MNTNMPTAKKTLRDKFWERFTLQELSEREWEELCDGCGRCCLLKLETPDTDSALYTCVSCRLLDTSNCRCKHYQARTKIVSDCIDLNADTIAGIANWMPATCAYRLLHEGKPLHGWHHLVSGDRDSVHREGISVSSFAIPETEVNPEQLETYVIEGITD